jgi:hypothetical protein
MLPVAPAQAPSPRPGYIEGQRIARNRYLRRLLKRLLYPTFGGRGQVPAASNLAEAVFAACSIWGRVRHRLAQTFRNFRR